MIGIIGYKNHSLKILNILIKLKYKNIFVYCRNKKKLINKQKNIIYTHNLEELYNCKIIFISSPSSTHFFYIKKFLNKNRYIFCEKPASITVEEIKYLKKLKKTAKENIYFNFNYIKSDFYNAINTEINNKYNGKLIHVSIYATHGLFFKNNFKKNWRIQSNNIFENITGNLGIHYINLLIHIFSKVKKINSFNSNFSKKGNDTSLISLTSLNGESASIFLSYASVFSQEIKFFFTNAIIEFKNNKIFKYAPRDTFDTNGRFTNPKKKLLCENIDLSVNSLYESIRYFMNISLSKKNMMLMNTIRLCFHRRYF